MNTSSKKTLSAARRAALLAALKDRFENNMGRHKGLAWANVHARLEAHPEKLWSLHEMEKTGGEPDLSVATVRRGNTSFMIAPRKARKAAEMFVTTAQGKRLG